MHIVIKIVYVPPKILLSGGTQSLQRCCKDRVAQEGGGGLREKGGMGVEEGGNRWYATLWGTSAATGGGRRWGGVGADKWVWEGGTFPQSASRDDEEGD